MTIPLTHSAYQSASNAHVWDYIALLKPRVMSLVIFTTWIGMALAPGTLHPFLQATSLLAISMGAGAAGALNMWYDRDIDAQMQRTQGRPLPQGRILPDEALAFGCILSGVSVLLLAFTANYIASAMLAFTIFYYVVIYTLWLKRWTPQNIVIGGAAGALPPVIGWISVTNSMDLYPWSLFLIIFLWTAPHFWALSLGCMEDYKRAKVPMLPITDGVAATGRAIMAYSVLTVAVSFWPILLRGQSYYYGVGAAFLGVKLLWHSYVVWRRPGGKTGMEMFKYSIFYLFFLFVLLVIDPIMGKYYG